MAKKTKVETATPASRIVLLADECFTDLTPKLAFSEFAKRGHLPAGIKLDDRRVYANQSEPVYHEFPANAGAPLKIGAEKGYIVERPHEYATFTTHAMDMGYNQAVWETYKRFVFSTIGTKKPLSIAWLVTLDQSSGFLCRWKREHFQNEEGYWDHRLGLNKVKHIDVEELSDDFVWSVAGKMVAATCEFVYKYELIKKSFCKNDARAK